MVIQTVTILVLAVIIIGLGVVMIIMARGAISWHERLQNQAESIKALVGEKVILEAVQQEYLERISSLQNQLRKIPLAPRTKAVDNQPKQARTSGDVRRMTEQAFTERPQVPLVQGDGSN